MTALYAFLGLAFAGLALFALFVLVAGLVSDAWSR